MNEDELEDELRDLECLYKACQVAITYGTYSQTLDVRCENEWQSEHNSEIKKTISLGMKPENRQELVQTD